MNQSELRYQTPSTANSSSSMKATSTEATIDNTLVSLVYREAPIATVASFFCATVILIGLYNQSVRSEVIGWYVFVIVVTLFRTLLIALYHRQEQPERFRVFWKTSFIVGALIAGITWGLTGSMLFPVVSSFQQTLIILILAGVTAGAVPILSGIVWASIAFLVASLFPLIITLLNFRNDISLLFDMTVLAFLMYLIVLSVKTHQILKLSIGLQFEKNNLLGRLSDAKAELETINSRLVEAATHDPLTKVANRNLFLSSLEQIAEKAKKDRLMFALLYFDLDGFKSINDIYGHHIGDQVLIILIERLRHIYKKEDFISRLGGDEFTIVIENIVSPNDVAAVCKRICATLAQPISIGNLELKVTASIGIAIYPNDSQDTDKLLNMADRAMYIVKEKGGNNYRFNVELLTE